MDSAITDLLSILGKQVNITEQLLANDSSALIDKNIVKAPNSTFGGEKSNLSSPEKKRTLEISSIFVKKFLEEQQKSKADTKLKTTVTSSGKGMTDAVKNFQENPKEYSKSLWDKVKDWVVLGLASLSMFWGQIKNALGKLGSAFKSLMTKLGSFVKKLMGGLLSSISKMWNGIKNSKIWKTLKSYISSVIKGVGKFFSGIRTRIGGLLKAISSGLRGFWGKVTGSKIYKSFTGAITGSKKLIGDFFKKLKDKILSVVSSVTKGIQSIIPGAKTAASQAVASGKGIVGNIISGGKELIGRGASAVVSGGNAVISGAKAVGQKAVNMTGSAAKKVISSAAGGVIKSAGGMFNLMGRLTAKGAAKVPIIGPAIESVLAAYDIKGMKERLAKGEITLAQLQQDAGRRVISGVTGMVGSAGGAVLAGALGSVIPVAGTALGAIVGAIGGDMAGRFLGGVISDYIIPQKYTKTIGAFVTGTVPPREEMQDFIIKDGAVHKFSSKDEVMGLKKGGAIDEFLRGGGSGANLAPLIKINQISNQLLQVIANNTTLMLTKLGGQSSSSVVPVVVSPSQQSESNQLSPIGNNRMGFSTSPYSLGR